VQNQRTPAIPKFGTWDVTNPNSGEGYTAIFSKIKEERQSSPPTSPTLHHLTNQILRINMQDLSSYLR